MDGSDGSLERLGTLIRDARADRGLTQQQLAGRLGTSQSAIARIEQGKQNLSLETIGRVGEVLGSPLVQVGPPGPLHLRITGGSKLAGSIDVRSSKNAAVALLCASLLNRGTTTIRGIARIEEVNRILEVLSSVGVRVRWLADGADVQLTPPRRLRLAHLDDEAARRTRSVIMFLGPLLHDHQTFRLPYVGGCNLGKRTVEPHLSALKPFGLSVDAAGGYYHATVDPDVRPGKPIVLVERGDTLTENVLLAAARSPGTTVIRNASPNYMVQDLCFFLQELGVEVEGIGTTTLTIHGLAEIDRDVDYSPSEDPIEAMSLVAAAIVTSSTLTIQRVPIEFLEIELSILETMGLRFTVTDEYAAANGRTRLVDLTVRPSRLRAPRDKVHPMPFPGLNIDNLPFFTLIAACAKGQTLVHDWVYENRAIYLTELTKIGATVTLMDPHRVMVTGPTHWSATEVICPPALRPAVVLLLAMLAAPGTSVLRNIYVINRGYEDLAARLNALGAAIQEFRDL
jgi:UDP-N-acetylglucosamine 1-carboxyvinyltransferase